VQPLFLGDEMPLFSEFKSLTSSFFVSGGGGCISGQGHSVDSQLDIAPTVL